MLTTNYTHFKQKRTNRDWAEIEKAAKGVAFLDVSCNAFTQIAFSQVMQGLEVLDISYNETTIAEAIFEGQHFPDLKHLYLFRSKLQKITFKGSFPSLETLHLAENELSQFVLADFPNLKTLYLYKNPLQNIPKEIFDKERGNVWEGVRNYLGALADGELPNDQIKLLLLGNSTAGKSSLLHFLISQTYEYKKASTHGIEHWIWQPYLQDVRATEEEKQLKIAIWDFGGQEFYHNTHSLFFSNNALYLVVFEQETNVQGKKTTCVFLYETVESEEKVEKSVELEHFHFHYWLNNILHYNPITDNVTTLLVQNKCDKAAQVEVSGDCKTRYGLKSNEQIFYLSVEKAFEKEEEHELEFARFKMKLLRHIKNNLSRFKNSKKWQEIKNKVQLEWAEKKVLTFAEYVALCEQIKPTIHEKSATQGESELETLTQMLHEQGVLLHFGKIAALKDKVFVHPQWLIDCIYRVLDYEVMKNEGQFAFEHLEKAANKLGKISALELLALLQNFKLIFEIEKHKKTYFIVPQYLPESFEGKWDILDAIENMKETTNIIHSFTFSYPDFLPVSVFLKFLAIYGNQHLRYWFNKNELVFAKNKKNVIAKCTRNENVRQISIAIQDNDAMLRQELFQTLYQIDPSPNIEISIDGSIFKKLKDIQNQEYRQVYETNFGFCMMDRDAFFAKKSPQKPTRKTLEDLVANAELGKAIKKLLDATEHDENDELHKELVNLSRRYNQNEKEKHRGVGSNYDKEQNEISVAFMDYIDQYVAG